ncbi:hypothetical protein BDZ45DRAFT_803771 [Acephala macrosclerotiorum]|nr:hypothetical protein BDZ45DRAFT_803771 [Acephala macrosclerotiorum]
MDILLAACGLVRYDGLLSLVPDWRRKANNERASLFVNRKRAYIMYTNGALDEEILMIHSSAFNLARKHWVGSIPSDKNIEAKVYDTLLAGYGKSEDHFEEILLSVMTHRRFFITKNGYLGVGPANTREGNIIGIIAGCNFPLIFCNKEDHHLLVREAYHPSTEHSLARLLLAKYNAEIYERRGTQAR